MSNKFYNNFKSFTDKMLQLFTLLNFIKYFATKTTLQFNKCFYLNIYLLMYWSVTSHYRYIWIITWNDSFKYYFEEAQSLPPLSEKTVSLKASDCSSGVQLSMGSGWPKPSQFSLSFVAGRRSLLLSRGLFPGRAFVF